MRLWIRNPLGIVAEGAGGGIVVDGAVIAELVAAGANPALPVDAIFDASQHVVLPGLINTHHHFYQTLTRAHPAAIDQELFPWLTALYPLWARLTPEDLRLAVRVALTELLLSGCTTAADHHYLYPSGLENAVDIAVDEARALGIRATISRGSMNLSQKDGGLPPDSVVQDEETILSDSERVLGLFHDPRAGRDDSDRAGALLAVFGDAVADGEVGGTGGALRRAAPHPSRRDQDEDAYCLQVYGKRPLDLLEETGWMRPKTWLAHGVHFSCEECERLGQAGVGICHCPTSNGVLASGFCRTRELEAAGAPLGLGVDGSASNDGSNLLEELRHALLINRLRYESASALTARDVIRWRRRARRAASAAATSGRSRRACRPIWRCFGSTSCAFPAHMTRSLRWCCAEPTGQTG